METLNKICDFFKEAKSFYIATIDKDRPRVRPFGSYMIYNGKLYFSTADTKPFWQQIAENPNIELCSCDGKGEWLRIEATANPDRRKVVKDKMLEQNPRLKQIYEKHGDSVALFYITKATATFENLVGKKEIFKF